jgi:predicted site-specific integrase-resolvase
MKLNQQKVEEAVLAVLWLTLHNEVEVWKTIDWDTMDRLHQKGLISDPARRAKSVIFTEEGLAEAERAARKILV